MGEDPTSSTLTRTMRYYSVGRVCDPIVVRWSVLGVVAVAVIIFTGKSEIDNPLNVNLKISRIDRNTEKISFNKYD